jgi:hypothetical protein
MNNPILVTDRQQGYKADPVHTYRGPILATMDSAISGPVVVTDYFGMIVKAEQADRMFKAEEVFRETDKAHLDTPNLETWKSAVEAACMFLATRMEFYGTTAPLDPRIANYIWTTQEATPTEIEKEFYRRKIRAEIATETDDIGRQCLEHSLALIDDPDSPWNQD